MIAGNVIIPLSYFFIDHDMINDCFPSGILREDGTINVKKTCQRLVQISLAYVKAGISFSLLNFSHFGKTKFLKFPSTMIMEVMQSID